MTTNPAPQISVVMPIYNGAKYLAAAIDSVLVQTFTDFELIVINDGSTDQSPAILVEYARRDARIKIINQANAGSPGARNVGIAQAQTDFVALMDADDISHPLRLEKQFAFLSDNPDYAAVACRCELIDESGRHIKSQSPRETTQEAGLPLAELLRGHIQINQTVMIRISSLSHSLSDSNQIYRAWFKVLEDFEFSLRIAEKHNLAHLNDDPPLYRYRQYQGQSTNLMAQNPLLFWYYWCAAVVSAYHRRNGTADPIIEAAAEGWQPDDAMPRLFELPHQIKACCLEKASHWFRRMLQVESHEQLDEQVQDFTDWILIIADTPQAAQVAKKTLRKIMFYLLRHKHWQMAWQVRGHIVGERLNDK